MSNNTIMWIVVAVYLAATIIVGYISSQKIKNADMSDYFVSKNSLPPIAVAFAIVATCMSGGMFVGMPAWGYLQGWAPLLCICFTGGMIGVINGNLILGKPMRRYSEKHSAVTINDLLQGIYQCKKITLICTPVLIIGSIFFAMVNWVAIGELLHSILGVSLNTAIILGVTVSL